MKASDLVESLKHFFFDVIGFLIPGFVTLYLLSIFVASFYFQNIKSIFHLNNDWNTFIILIFSYITGYIIYSIAALRDVLAEVFRIGLIIDVYENRKIHKIYKLFNFFKIELPLDLYENISKTYEYKTSLFILKNIQKVEERGVLDKFGSLNVQQARSIVISYVPDAQSQIYNFMFRSEICNFLSASFIFISLLGLISGITFYLSNGNLIFILKPDYQVLYILLFLCSVFFHKTRIRFLKIALSIPFSIFLSKYFRLQ